MQTQIQACKRVAMELGENELPSSSISSSANLKLIKLDDSIVFENLNDYFECNWCFRQFDMALKQIHVENCKFKTQNSCVYCSRDLINLNEYNRKTHIEHCGAKSNNKNDSKKRNIFTRSATKKNVDTSSGEFKKCSGYRPNIKYQTDSLYSNFPFQILDSDHENIKFVIENGVFHNVNCAKKNYILESNHHNYVNKLCSDLSYHKYLQNTLARSQMTSDFNSIPHCYLSYNQLKSEIDLYRDNLKRLKLENLNLKRTIESLRNREESYKRFINLLAQKEYSRLNHIITVCLNQKKGINGLIDKLLDTENGFYNPRDKITTINQVENVDCKICNKKVNLLKMKDHVTRHYLNKDVDEHPNRCGFCGQCDTCTIGFKITNQAIWPESNCVYFKNFNLKTSNRKSSNHPIECKSCKRIIWSFNLKCHFERDHKETGLLSHKSDNNTNNNNRQYKHDEVPCKICNHNISLIKMKDHVASHIFKNEIEINPNICGFCGRIGCDIQIKITSGTGKNTTYGPASNCEYFRKFNLKSSIRPTKSSPSTNRPIECHVCKQVYWSYNMKCHFNQEHTNEDPPELIADLEKEMVSKL